MIYLSITIVILFILLYYVPFFLWFAALVSGIQISLLDLIMMRIRKVPPAEIVKGLIAANKGGIKVSKEELETIFLAGGNIENIVHGMIAAKQNGLKLSFKNATKLDLEDIDIVETIMNKTENQSEFEKIQFE